MKEIPILGVVVGKGQVKMEQEKIKAVKEWKTLTKIKDVKSFLEIGKISTDSSFTTSVILQDH